ncbi:MAG: ATPase [Deltaproteobacteria bacterium CG11_big_fil_rev_8_21_14_0_20_45_16]|nr:MAG: ATPase [Deltaproteobacteria bacterium CG11_big_fil_rev_8_21_14_0_20_45_16]
MIVRSLRPPSKSFFLLGPRATGKSTWLRQKFESALFLNLLKSETYFLLLHSPEKLREIVGAEPKNRWIILDEIQRLPALTQEVHYLIESERRKFALSGSSARKLKRGQANLLAGRALMLSMFPMVYPEWHDHYSLDDALRFGSLPEIIVDPENRIATLEAYIGTYLREEVKEEALLRNLDSFSRFLKIASMANAQITNLSNLARDSGVSRSSITNYFQILEDTLIGFWLRAWTPKAKVKEVAHPKFYFFDTGVLRAIQGRLHDRPSADESGILLETYILHELRSVMAYQGIGGELSYWRTTSGTEIDFIWQRGRERVAIEVKSSKNWKSEFNKGFQSLHESKNLKASKYFGVYRGENRLKQSLAQILSVEDFLSRLHQGEILGS